VFGSAFLESMREKVNIEIITAKNAVTMKGKSPRLSIFHSPPCQFNDILCGKEGGGDRTNMT
jgi:hypothetical protein